MCTVASPRAGVLDMSEEAVRELCKRLPYVTETVIRHFLSESGSVEECYEQLKSSVTDYGEPISPQDRHATAYPNHTHDPTSNNPALFTHTSYPPGTTPSQDHYRAQHSESYVDTQWEGEGTPHRPPSSPRTRHRSSGTEAPVFFDDGARTTSLMELITAQKEAIEDIQKLRDFHVGELSKLRDETQHTKEELSDLRLKVSIEGSTRDTLANTQDLITTIRIDINEKKKKIAMWKSQVEMKTSRDVYTEEGVRWQCSVCGFLNHPLLPTCEHCSRR